MSPEDDKHTHICTLYMAYEHPLKDRIIRRRKKELNNICLTFDTPSATQINFDFLCLHFYAVPFLHLLSVEWGELVPQRINLCLLSWQIPKKRSKKSSSSSTRRRRGLTTFTRYVARLPYMTCHIFTGCPHHAHSKKL